MSRQSSTATQSTERLVLLDRINCLISFDQTGRGTEEAMALMIRHQIGAEELNARRMGGNRPYYWPTTPR